MRLPFRSRFSGPNRDNTWERYLNAVEPSLAAAVRVHRFAEVPIVADEAVSPTPIAVWIDGDGPAAQRTRDSLAASGVPAADVLGGPFAEALDATRAEYVLLVSAGDTLAPLALERFGQAVALVSAADVVTCDEDIVDPAMRRESPHFRPAPSPDRWLACDDTSQTVLVRRGAAQATIARGESRAPVRHDLCLRLAGAAAQRAAHLPVLLSHRDAARPLPRSLAAGAVQEIIREWCPQAGVEACGDTRRVRWPVIGEPSVEVIVCLRDKPELLARCIETLLTATEYPRLSVALVDNGSAEAATLAMLAKYGRRENVRVLHDPRPFNFAALNNLAARSSQADVVVFLNNDTEVIEPGWMTALLREAVRPQVGAVAPLLVFGDGEVQHAGAALGLHGYAGHPFAGLAPHEVTPFGRADQGTRNWLAVTAACLMVERRKFAAVGGFDESFVVAGNDVDLCLRLTAAGHRSLCVPEAVLIHHESRSRGAHIDPADFVRSEQSYGQFRTVGDPFYNPNLTLDATDCSVRVPSAAS